MKPAAVLLIVFGIIIIAWGIAMGPSNSKTTERQQGMGQLVLVGSGVIFLVSGIIGQIFLRKPKKIGSIPR